MVDDATFFDSTKEETTEEVVDSVWSRGVPSSKIPRCQQSGNGTGLQRAPIYDTFFEPLLDVVSLC